eukprot:TRINITY_DN12796_c0_g2_i3.p1 TRINITY_DN12796_c0_g2~~TRINITY_DN12796_c0_g2_i3.p1  ORF type:complete len:225 (-),score=26.89 TRINITY_DN12796_c0_g2_i3:53-685(-)
MDWTDGQFDTVQYVYQIFFKANSILVKALINSHQVSELTLTSILKIFEVHGKAVPLICHYIEEEINQQASPEELLRADQKASRMLGLYSQLIGTNYLNHVVSPLYRKLILDSKEYEVNPKHGLYSDTSLAASNLRKLTSDILNSLFRSVGRIPSGFLDLARKLRTTSETRFPNSGSGIRAVGNFFFLRFVCSSFISPETYGLKFEGSRMF